MFASSILRAIIRRPALWPEAVRALLAMKETGWWKRSPFLPTPRPTYVRWRLQTAYGSSTASPEPIDVIRFLEWRKAQR